MKNCLFKPMKRNKNPPCYMCGGRTRKSWANYCCMQDNGRCGWTIARWSKNRSPHIIKTFSTTKENRKNGVLPQVWHDGYVSMYHTTGNKTNTYIANSSIYGQFGHIDDRQRVIGVNMRR